MKRLSNSRMQENGIQGVQKQVQLNEEVDPLGIMPKTEF